MMVDNAKNNNNNRETRKSLPGVMTHAFNPSTHEAEAIRLLWVQGKPGILSEFQASQDCYIEKLCLKQTNKK